MSMRKYRIALWVLLLCYLVFTVPAIYSEDPLNQATKALEEISKLKAEEFWARVREIESLGKKILPVVQKGLRSPNVSIRLACAKLSYAFENKSDAILVLLEIIREEKDNEFQQMAGELLASLVKEDDSYGDKQKIAEEISNRLDETLSPRLRLALCRALYYVEPKVRAVKDLEDLLKLKDKDLELYFDTALALAEMGHFEKSKDALKILASYPTAKGKLARALLDLKQWEEAYQRKERPHPQQYDYDFKILNEILNKIKNHYVDPERFNIKLLLEAAAKGIANSLDRFSGYQTEEEKKRAHENLNLRYGGIGAYVNMQDDVLTIVRPIYQGPAYKAGLRSLDKITEIEGEPTEGKDLEYLVSKLKGPPNTTVKIKVFRRGWTKEREYSLTREIIQIENVRAEMLPGRIGFISIVTFGTISAKQMKQCLNQLKEAGMVALIIDLRGNPGGLLQAAVQIVDMILEKDKLIVTTRDKHGTNIEEFYTQDDDHINCPIYVLVDNNTASGSEILAGVLQDYKKAVIIGERTYGKGSVQNLIDLDATQGKTALRLTVAKYYLPSGRCIHTEKDKEGGIEPDIKLVPEERDPWEDYAFNKVYDSGELDKYYQTYAKTNKDLFMKLAVDDGRNYNRYPDFQDFYQRLKEQLNIRLTEDDVRQILREYIRRQIQDERGKEFIIDLENDICLQRGIVEALTKLNIKADTIPEYKIFAHKFDQSKKESITPPEKERHK